MKLWKLLIAAMKTGVLSHRSLLKAVRNRRSEQIKKLKTSDLDGPSDQIQKFTKLYFCCDSKN